MCRAWASNWSPAGGAACPARPVRPHRWQQRLHSRCVRRPISVSGRGAMATAPAVVFGCPTRDAGETVKKEQVVPWDLLFFKIFLTVVKYIQHKTRRLSHSYGHSSWSPVPSYRAAAATILRPQNSCRTETPCPVNSSSPFPRPPPLAARHPAPCVSGADGPSAASGKGHHRDLPCCAWLVPLSAVFPGFTCVVACVRIPSSRLSNIPLRGYAIRCP